ncbi:MAG: Omp28-related outer membrane protein, partial [Prevotella sp.]|nr:Omp28-related outer membrane protein [Prevotella sp.]
MTNVQKDGVTDYMFSSPNKDCWLDVVEQEMATDADANLDITASFDESTGKITMTSYYKFAISQDKLNIGILPIVVEDKLAGYQYNNFYKTVDPDLGPWQQGGLYGDEAVLYTHNDVARGIMASSYFGQTGIVPTSVKGGETYEAAMTFGKPSVENIYNCKVVCMMIDANTGRVINVARAKVVSSTGIEGVVSDKNSNTDNAIYTIDGRRVFDTKNMQKGLYIIGGKKVVVK